MDIESFYVAFMGFLFGLVAAAITALSMGNTDLAKCRAENNVYECSMQPTDK